LNHIAVVAVDAATLLDSNIVHCLYVETEVVVVDHIVDFEVVVDFARILIASIVDIDLRQMALNYHHDENLVDN
jgi:hypothetical protein